MIHNPRVASFRYDPYSKILSSEGYDVERMKATRMYVSHTVTTTASSLPLINSHIPFVFVMYRRAVNDAKKAQTFGVILGTLGRQGSPKIFERIRKLLDARGHRVIPFLMAEINPRKLQLLKQVVDVWVQVACPRLSIDWSGGFDSPILTPYELEVALGLTAWRDVYPMDYYSKDGGTWTNYN